MFPILFRPSWLFTSVETHSLLFPTCLLFVPLSPTLCFDYSPRRLPCRRYRLHSSAQTFLHPYKYILCSLPTHLTLDEFSCLGSSVRCYRNPFIQHAIIFFLSRQTRARPPFLPFNGYFCRNLMCLFVIAPVAFFCAPQPSIMRPSPEPQGRLLLQP